MKKIFVHFLIMLFIFTLSACGREDDIPESSNILEAADEKTEEAVWTDRHIELGYRFEKAIMKEGIIYGCYVDGEGIHVVSQDAQTGAVLRETKIENAESVGSITVDGQQNIYILGSADDDGVFWKIDSAGQLAVLEDFVFEDLENTMRCSLNSIAVDESGYFYIWCKLDLPLREFIEDAEDDIYTEADRIYVKDSQFNTIFYEQMRNSGGSRLLDFSLGEKAVPTILAEDPEGMYLQELDIRQKKASSKKRINNTVSVGEYGNVTATEDGFLFCQGSVLYQYLTENEETEKILKLSDYGVYPQDILYLGMDYGKIEIIDNYMGSSDSEYTFLQVGKSDKVQLTLGTVQTVQELEKAVTRFNRLHENICVKTIDYYDENAGFEAGLEKLKMDIVRGEAPDILETSMIDCDMLAKKGAFADLYQYIDQDKEIDREHLIRKILQIYELDGHLYHIAPGFQIYSMWGSDSVIKGQYGVTLKELIQILKNQNKDINAIYGFSADEPVLKTLCAIGMDEFVNWENNVCDFEGENFRTVLEFAKEYSGKYTGESLSKGIQNGDILLTVGIISSVADYQIQSKLYGTPVSFIGYPDSEGTGTAVGFTGCQFAINAKSREQAAAWEFVKYYLANGYQDWGFPIMKELYETVMDQAAEPLYISDSEGEFRLAHEVYMDADSHFEVYEAAQEDIDAIENLIERAGTKFEYHTEIQKIIDEEAAYYFEGQKDLDEVTKLIQNRVELYLME